MNVLIIEDDQTKLNDLEVAIRSFPGAAIIAKCASYSSGLRALNEAAIDVVILDMTIPLYDEAGLAGVGRKVQFGGELVLQEMIEEGMSAKVVVVSQHDYFADFVDEINLAKLGERLREKFGEKIVDTILYDSSEFIEGVERGWRQQLKEALLTCQTN